MEMKKGSLTEMIQRRSVDKQVKHRRPEVLSNLDIHHNSILLRTGKASSKEHSKNNGIIISQSFYISDIKESRQIADQALNHLAVQHAEPIGLMISLLLPEVETEETLRQLMKELNELCEERKLELIPSAIEVAAAVNQPVLSITAFGQTDCQEMKNPEPSQELVMTGWAGMEGTAILAKTQMEKLRTRLSIEFLEEAIELGSQTSIQMAASIAWNTGAVTMEELGDSGIFGALSSFSARHQRGFSVDLKKIPIRQETIEICEFFELNPYVLTSKGCLLIVTPHGNELVNAMAQEGIKACVIGQISENHQKIIMNDGEIRYLEPPKEDELSKA